MNLTLLLWSGAVVALGVALFLTVVRLLAGPSTLDRLISLDMLAAVAQCGIGVYIAWTRDTTPAAALVALALVAFLGSVSVARFRVHDAEGRSESDPREDGRSESDPRQAGARRRADADDTGEAAR